MSYARATVRAHERSQEQHGSLTEREALEGTGQWTEGSRGAQGGVTHHGGEE